MDALMTDALMDTDIDGCRQLKLRRAPAGASAQKISFWRKKRQEIYFVHFFDQYLHFEGKRRMR